MTCSIQEASEEGVVPPQVVAVEDDDCTTGTPTKPTVNKADAKENDNIAAIKTWLEKSQPKLQRFLSSGFEDEWSGVVSSSLKKKKAVVLVTQDDSDKEEDFVLVEDLQDDNKTSLVDSSKVVESEQDDTFTKTKPATTEDINIAAVKTWIQNSQPKLRRFLSSKFDSSTESNEAALKEQTQEVLVTHKDSNTAKDSANVESDDSDDDNDAVIVETPEGSFFASRDDAKALAKKVGAAIVGGTLIITGIPLIPLPGPGDFMVVGGFAVLATEFEGPRRVLDGARDKLEELLDKQEEKEKLQEVENASDEEENKEKEQEVENNTNEEDENIITGDRDSLKDTMQDESKNETKFTPMEIGTVEDGFSTNKDWNDNVKTAKKEIKRRAEQVGRNVLLPMLNAVCTERPTSDDKDDDNETTECNVVISDDADELASTDEKEENNNQDTDEITDSYGDITDTQEESDKMVEEKEALQVDELQKEDPAPNNIENR